MPLCFRAAVLRAGIVARVARAGGGNVLLRGKGRDRGRVAIGGRGKRGALPREAESQAAGAGCVCGPGDGAASAGLAGVLGAAAKLEA